MCNLASYDLNTIILFKQLRYFTKDIYPELIRHDPVESRKYIPPRRRTNPDAVFLPAVTPIPR